MSDRLHNSDEEQHINIDIHAILQVISRRRVFLAAVFLFVLLSGLFFLLTRPRIYRSTATVVVNQRTPALLGNSVQGFDNTDNYTWLEQKFYYETQYELLESRPIAEKAFLRLGISTETLAKAIETDKIGAPVADGQGIKAPPYDVYRQQLIFLGLAKIADKKQLITTLKEFDGGRFVRSRIVISPVQDSSLVHIHGESEHPEYAARIANALMNSYIEYNLSQRIEGTRSAVDWLSGSVLDLKEKLEIDEKRLQEYKEKNKIISISLEDRQSMLAQSLISLNGQLSVVLGERVQKQAEQGQLKKYLAGKTPLPALAQVTNNLYIQSLKQLVGGAEQKLIDLKGRYTAKHPKIISASAKLAQLRSRLHREIALILATAKQEYETQVETVQGLRVLIEQIKQEALDLNSKELKYRQLEREIAKTLEIYSLVTKRQKEAELSQMLNVNNVYKLEMAAVSHAPIRPAIGPMSLLIFVFSMLVAIIAVFIVETLDNTVKRQEQIEHILGMPFLGILPALDESLDGESGSDFAAEKHQQGHAFSGQNLQRRDQYVAFNPKSATAECFRIIRTNLLYMMAEAEQSILLITSANPREGKSTVAIQLAVTMANTGSKVILIDTDMRRPRLHKSFSLSNKVGVSNVIIGQSKLSDAIVPSTIENLDIIPCGLVPPNPSELLHTAGFKTVLNTLKKDYDTIILDSPPVQAVTDALILCALVDRFVFVIKAGETTIPSVKYSLQQLKDVGGKEAGVVLNNVDVTKNSYGAYPKYTYYRSGYYGSQEEEREQA